MNNQFELVGGSILGREHLRVGKNNQDAYDWSVTEASTVAVVCDGCGSGKHSEVGAKLGARMVVKTLQRVLSAGLDLEHEEVWQTLQHQLLIQLQQVVEGLGDDYPKGETAVHRLQTIHDYLLFTIAGVVITPDLTTVFALGDGVIAINEQVIPLGPFPNNAPPYLVYGLLSENDAELFSLKVVQSFPTENLQTLLIGSDGVSDLIQIADQCLPGRSHRVGDIAQFWRDDCYFHNPDQVRRRLTLINREVTTVDPSSQQCVRQPGLLPDDTTLIVIRRKKDAF